MYAQLCKRLSEEAPNFAKTGPCTFRLLLLNKCKVEFENRSQASEAFDNHHGPISAEEEERRQLAKRKMLGNIKFIGELGKLEILAEGILHKCIQQLLVDKRRKYSDCQQALQDQCEDLECLCQIMRTCGRVLDTDKGQKLMYQYFERMSVLADNQELPPRIRFMLRDVIELRRDNWVPRKATCIEGPVPIHQIRPADDDSRSGGGGGGGGYARDRRDRNQDRDLDRQGANIPESFFRHPMKMRTGLVDDLLPGLGMQSPTAPLIPTHDKYSNFNPNGFGGGGGGGREGYRGHNQRSNNYNNYNNQRGYTNKHNNQRGNNNAHNSQYNNNVVNKEMAPRFKNLNIQLGQQGLGDVELRPAANSMLFKQANIKPSVMLGNNRTAEPAPLPTTPQQPVVKPAPLHKEPLLIKQASQDKAKQTKKDKGPNKEEVLKKLSTLLDEYLKSESSSALTEAVSAYREHKVPDKFSKDVVLTMFNTTLERPDTEKAKIIKLLTSLRKDSLLSSSASHEGFKALCGTISERETEIPRIGTLVASFAALGVNSGLFTLTDVSSWTENGTHYPLFLLVLQQLNKTVGKTELTKLFNDSKINLMSQLPEVDRTKERLAEILEDRGLLFLFPMLRIQAELSKQLQADPNPQQFYKWIRENIDATYLTETGFVNALMTVLLKYVTEESTLPEGMEPSMVPEKNLQEKERGLLERYKPVLNAFLNENAKLQVTALYSLQVYCHTLHFPKGMLLRWFVALYDLEIIEEEAFLHWKEDVNEAYLGKGDALFQVNTWLTWLQEAESEDDEADE